MELTIKGTKVFRKNYEALLGPYRFIVNQGGARSSKTYSLAEIFLILLVGEPDPTLLTIARKTLPALRSTAMRDFFDIMKSQNLYDEELHNKSGHLYKYGQNELEFISVDEPQKIRGRKRKYLWMNEANEFSYEDFQQLNLRTEAKIFMDFNPSDEFHWIYDHVLTRSDTLLIKSSYLDNPFLEPAIIKEIEALKEADPNYWKIYGLGERGSSNATIYNHWDLVDALPENPDETILGLDFGFNNPTALGRVDILDKEYYSKELIYESHLTNSDLIVRMNNLVEDGIIDKSWTIYADAAEPQRIQEINEAGFYCLPADKDVKKGIDTLRSHKWHITKDSTNTIKEVQTYKWKQRGDIILDEPVKFRDHAMDMNRYAIHTHGGRPEPQIHIL